MLATSATSPSGRPALISTMAFSSASSLAGRTTNADMAVDPLYVTALVIACPRSLYMGHPKVGIAKECVRQGAGGGTKL